MKNKKEGISLIVLVITIIVMIILAAAIILTLNDSGIINRANEAVDSTNLKEVQQIASLAWSEAYLDNRDVEDEETKYANIKAAVDKALENIDVSDYNIVVDEKGVTVTPVLEAGLYDANGKMLASWDELINKYGVDFDSVRRYPGDKSSTALGTIIDNNEELRVAFELRLPEDYTTIQSYAFSKCTRINRVIIPQSITSIGGGAFTGCEALIEICNKSSLDIVAGAHTYGEIAAYAKQVITDESQTKLKTVGDFVFYDDDSYVALMSYIGNSMQITLPTYEEEYTIYKNSFQNIKNLTSVSMPEGVTGIGSSAFSGCTFLTNISIPEGVISIGEAAFNGCASLTSINIPKGVTSIGRFAFSGCTSLTSINIPEGVTSVDIQAFAGCTSLTNISVPEGVTNIYSKAFADCTSLTTITFEGTVEQWNTITFDSNWKSNVPATEVVCSNGTVAL